MSEELSPWINEEKPIEKSVEETKSNGLPTNYKDPKKRYELAERMVWAKLPLWKRQTIIKCKVNGTNDRIFDEYAHEIAIIAENESVVLTETSYPPVPHLSVDKKPEVLTK